MGSTADASSEWCLQQGGEMGARMRALDWSRTLLGPVAQWPRSLKIAVALCLRSRFPIVILWGREDYAMLYNDAYIPVLGAAKHPGWLGMSGRECWREVWPTVGPMMDSVLDTGEPTWSEDLMLVLDRRLPREECYFTFSYGAIPGVGCGKPGGIFCVCAETTERVIGERRLRTLRELGGRALLARSESDAADTFAQTLAANRADLPFALLYLLDHERRIARLAAVSGLERGGSAAPLVIDARVPREQDPWRLREALLGGQPLLLEDLEERWQLPASPAIAAADAPGNPVRCALVLPLSGSGRTLGFLVAGVSPRRVLDEPYRAFCNLIAGHIATGLVMARPFVEEALRWLPERRAPDAVAEPLPVPAEPIVPAREIPAAGSEEARGRPLVLCADDNTDLRCYISRLLAPLYDVIAVGDGEEALETALIYRPDLIIADVMMPQMDGTALLKALRASPRTAAIPLVLLSARAGEEARIEGLEAGADDYLEKPFSARELLARVRAQLALSLARRAHEREREDFHTLFMQAPNVFLILRGTEYVVELANPAACRVLRRAHEELLERPLFEAVPELEETGFRSTLDSVLRTGAPYQGREVSSAVRWRGQREPKVEYYNYVFSPLRSIEGRIEGVLIDAFSVTEEVIARQEMGRLRAAAESANRMKDEFLAMLGHELRNPLAPILMSLQVMRLRGVASRELEILERQVSHLTRLVDDLLDVSRITRGRIELRRCPLELSEVVGRAIETVTPLLTARRHRLEVDVPAQGLLVLADPERLAQVLLNLLTNAAKYSEPGSAIRMQARRRGPRVELCVRDEGVGIAPEMLERVFDVFVQQPQTLDRSAGGLGLGLAIVRSLVEMHEGTVSARSAGPGRGSEFVIDLPALDPQQPAPSGPVRSWPSLVPPDKDRSRGPL